MSVGGRYAHVGSLTLVSIGKQEPDSDPAIEYFFPKLPM